MQAETRRDPVQQFEVQTGAVTVLPWPDIFAFVAERQLPFSAAVAFTAASSIQASQRRRLLKNGRTAAHEAAVKIRENVQVKWH